MEDIFNLLSGSARLDKSKRKKRNREQQVGAQLESRGDDKDNLEKVSIEFVRGETQQLKSRDRTGKRDTSKEKLEEVHKEQIAAFRRSMAIRLANKNDPEIPDPVSSFHDLSERAPSWWSKDESDSYLSILRAIQRNIEAGRWKEPTPIQMQSIPTLLERRDYIGAAPTGSGKSGAFILPALLISSAPYELFYGSNEEKSASRHSAKKKKKKTDDSKKKASRQGEIRVLLLAPSLELASQLHREVERLGMGKPGGLSSILLSKSNATQVIAGTAGGKKGVDVLVSTPLRLVDSIEKGMKLDTIRMVVLDEADRLLDASDGKGKKMKTTKKDASDEESSEESSDESESESGVEEDNRDGKKGKASGTMQSQSFLAQMDAILSEVPTTAIRALFSATVTPMVRSLSESILRNPVDVTIAGAGRDGGANSDIEQELMFVGREEGKLLAIRQLSQRGEIRPPVIIFLESQERAQALFSELLYDGLHVDVIHAGRSKAARENAVAKFRKGDTWVLICTDLVARGVDFRAVNMVINYDLPSSGVTYVHRIGRTGRAGRKGKAITLFTESDFDNLRTIANVMRQSGCNVEEWMLNLPKKQPKHSAKRSRNTIDTTPSYDKKKRHKKQQMIKDSKKKNKLPNKMSDK